MRSSFYLAGLAVTKPTCQSRTGVRTRDLILSAACFCIHRRRCTHAGTHVSPSWCCLFILRRGRGGDDNAVPRAIYLVGECTCVPRVHDKNEIQITFLGSWEKSHVFLKTLNSTMLFNRRNWLYVQNVEQKKIHVSFSHTKMWEKKDLR